MDPTMRSIFLEKFDRTPYPEPAMTKWSPEAFADS